MTHTEIVHNFLRMIVAWDVEQAYATYTSEDFVHHNQYFPWDKAALKQGMIDNHENFPHKEYTMFQTISDGDTVAVHGLMKLNEHVQVAVVHICKVSWGKIIEMRDVWQVIETDSPNKNGIL